MFTLSRLWLIVLAFLSINPLDSAPTAPVQLFSCLA